MTIENIVAFGRFVPGDFLEIPDDSIFDHAYWREMKLVTHTVEHEVPTTVTETVMTEVPETVTDLEPVGE